MVALGEPEPMSVATAEARGFRECNGKATISHTARGWITAAGIPGSAAGCLFDANAVHRGNPGDDAYVAQGIEGMRQFMAKWEPQLRAAQLKDGQVVIKPGELKNAS